MYITAASSRADLLQAIEENGIPVNVDPAELSDRVLLDVVLHWIEDGDETGYENATVTR